ncbi:MAG: alpha/beta hydrolase [Actinomycetales bacterium]
MTLTPSKTTHHPVTVGVDTALFAGHYFPAEGGVGRVLQVLIHGNSYDHRYWNADQVNGQDYSYVRYMAGRGHDLLAIDLPGVGASDRPDGHAVSLAQVGVAVSRLVASLRQESTLGRTFEHICLVGHSMGAAIATYSEGRWPAADSLVVTATGFFPDRPRSAWAPGVREALLGEPYALLPREGRLKFYHQAEADPEVIAYDNETLRTAMPSGLWADCITLQDDPKAGFADVSCPVFLQLGEFDPILPAQFIEQERAIYSAAPVVEVDPIADMGHSFNLHRNAERSWSEIDAFLSRRLA